MTGDDLTGFPTEVFFDLAMPVVPDRMCYDLEAIETAIFIHGTPRTTKPR
jgi:hypothetical protein